MKKIGILTLPFEPNYGWVLQLWALYHFLQSRGYDVEVIDRRWNDKNPSFIKSLKRWIYYNVFCLHFSRFFASKFKRTFEIRSSEEMTQNFNLKKYDAVIVGSDQVWRMEHTRGADLNYYLDFLKKRSDVVKIAYAASFGIDTWNGTVEEKDEVSALLSEFTLISVREETGIDICSNVFRVRAEHVLDPTMLLERKEYEKLLSSNHKKGGVVTYILDFNSLKSKIVDFVAMEKTVDVRNLFPQKHSLYSFHISIDSWLSSIKDANFVIVDSFHGMVFSILFEKDFLVIGNKKRGLTRFKSLLGLLELEERLVDENVSNDLIRSIINTPVDYVKVNERLSQMKKKSINLLLRSLDLTKKSSNG